MATIGRVRQEVQRLYEQLHNWRAVGSMLGISGGMAHRIANRGYEPKDVHIRLQLGLPAMGEAPVCERCGVVHVSKRCTARRRPRWRDLWEVDVDVLRDALERRREWR